MLEVELQLSMKFISKVPIKFLGVGEKIENLEVFHPDRIANRILEWEILYLL